jgi:hypothetical protein
MLNSLNSNPVIFANSYLKTVTTGFLGLVVLCTANLASAQAHPKYTVCKKRVGVTVSLPGRSPFLVSRYLARQKAVSEWRKKTRNRYGNAYARWRFARAKFNDAEGGIGTIYYTVSANPCRSDTVKIAHHHH